MLKVEFEFSSTCLKQYKKITSKNGHTCMWFVLVWVRFPKAWLVSMVVSVVVSIVQQFVVY